MTSGRRKIAAVLAVLAATALVASCAGNHPESLSGGAHDHLLGDANAQPTSVTRGPDGLWLASYPQYTEVSAWPIDAEPSAEQRRAGDDFVAQVREALQGLTTVDDAVAAGYDHPDGIDEFHLVNRTYLDDDALLNPQRPEFLVIDPDAGLVLGAMFLWTPGEHGPQLAGPASVWHFHDATSGGDAFRCWDGPLPAVGAFDPVTDTCSRGDRRDQSPEMLHVWSIDHPGGPFATPMPTRS